jgi:poly-beta-1,6-N-acetyl-D-glucosamine synthase
MGTGNPFSTERTFVQRKYVLMTAAYNEEQHIEKTLRSVVSQTVQPERWVIVSDNSSDRTDQIIENYARQYDFIRFLRVNRPKGRSFGSKARALHRGAELLESVSYNYIGNVDADLSLPRHYFDGVLAKFEHNPKLGIASGFVHEENHGEFTSRKINDVRNVPHAAQLVRRLCYEEIGGYAILEHGGEDWYAQIEARMKGWEVESFPELHIFHHRHTGEGSPKLATCIRLGKLDYSFGSDPLFEALKCVKRVGERPYVLGAALRLAAFCWESVCRKSRPVSDDFVAFLRNEQRGRLGLSTTPSQPKKLTSISGTAANLHGN